MCIENRTTMRLDRRLETLDIDDVFYKTSERPTDLHTHNELTETLDSQDIAAECPLCPR